MEAELTKRELSFFRCIARREAAQEETIEVLIGDALPDAAEIIDAEAAVFLRSKETEDGLVRLKAAVEGSILYGTEDGTVCSVPLRSECRMEWTGSELKRDGQLCAEMKLCRAEGRMLNSRKLLLQAELCGSFSQWRSETVSCVCAAAADHLETKIESTTLPLVCGVSEKSFAVTEQFTIPEECERASDILLQRCSSWIEEVNSVAGKLILQGRSRLELLYRDEPGSVCSQSFTAAWSQLMDIPAEPDKTRITLMDTARYIDIVDGGEAVSLEAHLTAQLQCTQSVEIETLADAYSTAFETESETETLRLSLLKENGSEEKTLRDSMALPEDAERTLFGRGEVRKGANGVTLLSVSALCQNSGGALHLLKKEIACEGEARLKELKLSRNGNELELNAALEFQQETEQIAELSWLKNISLLEDKPLRKRGLPGLVIVRRDGADAWNLAKKYGSTVTLMEKANEDMDEKDAFLFIPRAR